MEYYLYIYILHKLSEYQVISSNVVLDERGSHFSSLHNHPIRHRTVL
jgi:hypothetical protein